MDWLKTTRTACLLFPRIQKYATKVSRNVSKNPKASRCVSSVLAITKFKFVPVQITDF